MVTTSFASLRGEDVPAGTVATPPGDIAGLERDELIEAATRRLYFELDLPATERRRRVIERLRNWLELDPESARPIAEAFAAAAAKLDQPDRDEIARAEEDAVMDGLGYAEFRRLAQFVPSLKKWLTTTEPEEAQSKQGFLACLAAALATAQPEWELQP
jgi:hypothetical protein